MTSLSTITAADATFDPHFGTSRIIETEADVIAHLLSECDLYENEIIPQVGLRAVRKGSKTESEAESMRAGKRAKIAEVRDFVRNDVTQLTFSQLMIVGDMIGRGVNVKSVDDLRTQIQSKRIDI